MTACPRRLVGSILNRFDLGDHTGLLLARPKATDAAPSTVISAIASGLRAR